jgi:hypothetical protein
MAFKIQLSQPTGACCNNNGKYITIKLGCDFMPDEIKNIILWGYCVTGVYCSNF